MKISELIWMMVLTASVVLSMTGVVAAQKDGPPLTAGPPVKAVTATAPLVSSGGSTPDISLPDGSIGTSKLASGAVVTADIADGAVTGSKLADNAVTGAKVVDGSLTGADIQNGSIGPSKLTGVVTAVTTSAPLVSSGGSAPNLSLPGVIIGTNTTAIGNSALALNTGFGNTASGARALALNTTGGFNTASGFDALFSNTTGGNNTASGFDALFSNTTGIGNTASGAGALASNTTGGNNTASGLNALPFNTTGGSNTASGLLALRSNTTGNNNTGVGTFADVSAPNLTNATAFGANAVVNASNKIRLGDTNVTVIEGQVGFTSSSDATKKENFQPVDGQAVLNKIQRLSLTSWNFIGQDSKQFRHYGPTAQEFFAAFGSDGLGTIGTPTTITTTDIDGILMIAVQTLQKRTMEQSEEVETLKAENATLKAHLEALERLTKEIPLQK